MKVLVVIDSLAVGGTEQSVAEMVPRLGDRGVDATVVTLEHSGPGHEVELRRIGEDVRVLRSSGRLAKVRELRRLVRALDPDVVHTQLFESDVTGRLAAAHTRAAVLTSLVNTSYEPVRRRDPAIRAHRLEAARLVESWTARHLTDHFHAVSDTVKQSAVRHLGIPPDRISVVARGRDPERLGQPGAARRARARARLGVEPDAPVLLNVGRQEFQKGQRYLVDAFDTVARARPAAVLLIAGRPGAAAAELRERQRQSPSGSRIRFLGARDDVPELLAAADVFVSSSLYEGMPGAVLEAFALGLPVVATDIGPNRDVAEDGRSALFVGTEDAAGLAAAIERVLDDPVLARALGERGREVFAARFTIDVSVGRMVELYEQLRVSAGGADDA